jgi:calcium permeable stress-gated cation channel
MVNVFRETRRLAILIDERDEILNNLEMAETRYIASFRISTPDPSIATYEPPIPQVTSENDGRPVISRPKPLTGTSVCL